MLAQFKAMNFIFRMASDHSGIVNKTSGAAIATPDVDDNAYILKNHVSEKRIVETSGFSFDESRIPTVKIVHTDLSNDYLDFLKISCPGSATVATLSIEEITSETGEKIGGSSSSSGVPYLVIRAVGDVSGKIYTQASIVVFNKAETLDFKAGTFVRRTLEGKSVACAKTGGFVIPQECFDPTIWGAIDEEERTIAENGYYIEYGLTKAA